MAKAISSLIGKSVIVCKLDGVKKKGKLLAADDAFVQLEFYDGKIEFIPLAAISNIFENGGQI